MLPSASAFPQKTLHCQQKIWGTKETKDDPMMHVVYVLWHVKRHCRGMKKHVKNQVSPPSIIYQLIGQSLENSTKQHQNSNSEY